MEGVLQDIRYAFRGFHRNPVFAVSVLLTLALGLGTTTAVFSVVDRILFRPLPYADAGRIVSVGLVQSLERQEFVMGRSYVKWRDAQKPFTAMAGQSTMAHNCDLIENNPVELSCIQFQAGMLPLFGITPAMGRNFTAEEDSPNGPRAALISYDLWKGHYNGNPHILETSINVDGKPARVVGVLPKDFQFPTLESAEIVLPIAFDPAIQTKVNGGFGYPMRVFARLKPGVSLAQAHAEMQPLFEADLSWFPPGASKVMRLSIRSLRDRETQEAQPVAWILLGFVTAVLLIACANVASLMMARGAARRREIAVRTAVGASRARLAGQAVTEALLLSVAGGATGLLLAGALLTLFVKLAPTGIPFIASAHLDLRIAGFTALLSCVCGVLFGLASALERPGLETLKAKSSMVRGHAWLRRCLVIAQIAISIVLFSGAVLLLRSFARVEQQNLGMRTGGVLTVKVALPGWRYDTDQKVMDLYLRLEAALRRVPGTRAVAISDSVPPGGWQSGFRFSGLMVEGKAPIAAGTDATGVSRFVTPDYFRALDIPILRGRGFREEDRTAGQNEVVLSRLMATTLFGKEDPIGKRLRTIGVPNGASEVVVGVAEDVKNGGLTAQNAPEMYTFRRSVPHDWGGNHLIVILDSVMPAKAVEPWVHAAVASLDATVPVQMEVLDQTVNRLADRPRFETALLAFFAGAGLTLAVVGLYGLMAYLTTQRTHEIGIRMALGATRENILGLITADGLRLVAIGGAIGLATALGISRLLKALLFEVSPTDPLTFVLVSLILGAVALVAILVPARAGMRVEPAITLRAE
ncbi:ABC transporter permease [Acidobacteria bacterium AB60]|nr:ABC transporter permease [Acidobacteria bacterium AB60]